MSKDSDNWDDFSFGEEISDPAPSAPVPKEKPEDKEGIRWSLIAGLVLITAITVLAAQNTQNVTLNFLGWDGRAPLIAIILGTTVVAILFDEAVGFVWRRRRRKELAEKEELKRLRSERPG